MISAKTPLSSGFGSSLTPLGKRLLLLYGAVYVIELVCEHWLSVPLAGALELHAAGQGSFRFWQIITHAFVHNPYSPLSFVINCVVLYFFAGPVQYAFGQKRFLILFYGSALGAAVCGLCFSSIAGLSAPFMGMLPSLLSLIVVFGLLNPEATILLMFVLPVRAKYLSYGTALITLLTFLAKANPHGAYHLGGILTGYLYLKGYWRLLNPRFIYCAYLEWQLKRKRSRFKVLDGYKDNDDDKPTYH